ncbi:MAG: pentapeptide repeat-containing protein [Thiobacillus sp.]|nr:pentapeptide repeat-containing protein [Thiobacillus sp.]
MQDPGGCDLEVSRDEGCLLFSGSEANMGAIDLLSGKTAVPENCPFEPPRRCDDVSLKTKEDFEGFARLLHDDFSKKIKPMRESSDRANKLKLLGIVGGTEASQYCRELGALFEKASQYEWKGDPPQISAEFRQLRIDGWLNLQKAQLPKVLFDSVTFSEVVAFDKASFLGEALFINTDFQGAARFDNANFADTAVFNNSKFFSTTEFINVNFSGLAEFSHAQFLQETSFVGSTFEQGSNFNNSDFVEVAKFNRVSFKGNTSLERCAFQKYVDFGKAEFGGNTSLRGTKFEGCVDFQNSRFIDKAYFNGAAFSEFADFDGVAFLSLVVFSNCQFKTTTVFFGANFSQCPRFHEAELHQDTSFIKAKFGSMGLMSGLRQKSISIFSIGNALRKVRGVLAENPPGNEMNDKKIGWDSEARAYRTLKLLMSKHQAQHEAAQFFAAEMRCRRRQFGWGRPVHNFTSLVYDLFSEFGMSVGRVLFVLLLVNALFTFGYYQQAQQDLASGHVRFAIVEQPYMTAEKTPSHRWELNRPWWALSLQSLNPVAFLSPKNTWVQVYDGRVFLQGVSQSLLNLVLLILLAISLRGQFRRGAGGGD